MSGPDLYYEDLDVGHTVALGSTTVSADDIVEFAERYDPMPFHLDESAASEHGGLIASGYHTLCLANRLVVDGFRGRLASIAGLGIEDLRWRDPVRPGDTLTGTLVVADARVSRSDPGRGIVSLDVTVTADGDRTVLEYTGVGMVHRRTDPR